MLLNRSGGFKTFLFSVLALFAFAANSVFARLALGAGYIDGANFTILRLLSAIVMLLILIAITNKNRSQSRGSFKSGWFPAVMLFIYACSFSFAYVSLDTGTGALVLFTAVQITMVIKNHLQGNRLTVIELLGLIVAFSGFVYLIFPSLSQPTLLGFILMTISGIAWAFYTLKGQAASDPLLATKVNFLRTLPFIIILFILYYSSLSYTWQGVLLATMSGALASALGYYCWYLALAGLSTTVASVIQLSVPIIAALGGIIFMSEAISIDFIIACTLVCAGILLVIFANYQRSKVSI
ncbi:DMT family transporter [Psychromonas sp.]|uniref:DMT family transporter n=1 Tax=Psychromonas sp. TaxID=1884585 RepID=UPI003568D787